MLRRDEGSLQQQRPGQPGLPMTGRVASSPAVHLLSRCLSLRLLCWLALVSPDTGKDTSWPTAQVTAVGLTA